jgi:putative transcriptional regulator
VGFVKKLRRSRALTRPLDFHSARIYDQYMGSVLEKGALLIAGPGMYDPNFRQSVILLCEHNDRGSMGLVINRPTELVLTEAVHQLAEAARDDVIYSGGPVQPDHLLILIRSGWEPPSSHHVFSDVYLGTDLPTLKSLVSEAESSDAASDNESVSSPVADTVFRGYAGYAGWSAGQLDGELTSQSWIVVPADSKWIFDADPTVVWPELMRSLGPRHAVYATMPRDPNLN